MKRVQLTKEQILNLKEGDKIIVTTTNHQFNEERYDGEKRKWVRDDSYDTKNDATVVSISNSASGRLNLKIKSDDFVYLMENGKPTSGLKTIALTDNLQEDGTGKVKASSSGNIHMFERRIYAI